MGPIIPFRLRPGKDDDIRDALEQAAVREDRSDVIRAALRAYLLEQRQQQAVRPGPGPQLRPENLDDIELEVKEKDDDQLAADLDKLLDF